MGRYIVGNGSDYWNLDDAYNTVVDGDIIEFEKNFRFDLLGDSWKISKNITICGSYEIDENGRRSLFSSFYGKIEIVEGAEVIIENMCVYSNKDTAAFRIGKESKLIFADSIVGSTRIENNSYLIYNDGGSLEIDNITLELEGKSKAIYFYEANGTIQNCNNLYKIDSKNSEISILNSQLFNDDGNGIITRQSKIELLDSYIEGSHVDVEKRYPVVWSSQSNLNIKNTTVFQPQYAAAICIINNSYITEENTTSTSVEMNASRGVVEDVTISESLTLQDLSLLVSKKRVSINGENSGKVDILVSGSSIINMEELKLNREDKPHLRLKDNSHIRVKNLDVRNFNDKEIVLEVEETSSFSNLTKKEMLSSKNSDKALPAKEQLDNLIGLKKVKTEIEKMLRMVDFNNKRIAQGHTPEKQALHAVFMGNPGTGKTTVARLIGKILFEKGALSGEEFVFVEAKESDLISSNVGGTAPATKELLEKARGGVLFIDEAYTLNKKGSVNFGIEAINTILAFMEDHRDEIMIIFAGYTKEMDQFLKSNPGLRSRVPNTFYFEDYSPDEIVQIGNKYLESKSYNLEDKEYYNKYVKNAYNASLDKSNARWIRNTNESILKAVASRVIENDEDDVTTIKNVDIDSVMNIGKFDNDGNKKDAMQELNKLIGIRKVKEQVEQFIALAEINKKRSEQGKSNSSFSLHSLFLGNPGTGKTTVARLVGEVLYQKGIIAKNKLIEVSRTDLVAGYIGHTGPKTREVLESALGGVLFIDEAYSLKGNDPKDFGGEAIDEILKFMEDHRENIVIIFAGYTKEMEEFLKMNSGLRSRIPNTFNFEDYSADEIVEIGLLGIDKYEYKVDREFYSAVIKELYLNNNGSNGRWVRNMNEKLISYMSTRVSREGGENVDEITNEDIQRLKESVNE